MHAEPAAPYPVPDLPPVLSDERAAEVAGRSVSWVRKRRRVGQLVAAELEGRPGIETKSLLRLMSRRPAKSQPAPVRLALVVDNGPLSGCEAAPEIRGHLRVVSVDGRAVELDHP